MAPSSTLKSHSAARPRPGIRRLSSMTANAREVTSGGPVVVVPERLMREPLSRSTSYQGGNFAASLENARNELNFINLEEEESSSSSPDSPSSPLTPAEIPTTDSFAFAFDIDGVLIRGGRPIPEAIEAMRMLNGDNEYGVRIPYIFLTNGGGKTEAERCIDLSGQLDIEVSPSPIYLWYEARAKKCRQVAEGYGFRDVITPGDIIKDNEHTTPFRKLTAEELKNSRGGRDYSKTKIEAIFVFADSRDWACDVQIMLDLAMSKGGYIGALSETFDEGPPIYFSHSDIVWSAAHENVRLGMGALRKMTEMLFRDLTKGKELETIAGAKMNIAAIVLLRQFILSVILPNPISEARNQYNEKAKNEWYSILVRTGVFQEGTEPAYKPKATVDTVLDAVKHGMDREFKKKSKEDNPRGLTLNSLGGLSLDGKPITGGKEPEILNLPSQVNSEAVTPEFTD
ncbi:hypothetical protein DID88_003239 [Monilinia fructigena]|uniref:Uncharacterized protein n=1 Tax=Monilinia fructigena TaxID=38457 RepID=A0A395IV74_9HELO|nr:hypothetical protein DID88_003239 [Monilinia fructigena]